MFWGVGCYGNWRRGVGGLDGVEELEFSGVRSLRVGDSGSWGFERAWECLEGVRGVLVGGMFGELGNRGRGVWIGLGCLGGAEFKGLGSWGVRVRVVDSLGGVWRGLGVQGGWGGVFGGSGWGCF